MTLARGTREVAIVRAPAAQLPATATPIVVIQQLVVELCAPAEVMTADFGPAVRTRRAIAAYAEPTAVRPVVAIG